MIAENRLIKFQNVVKDEASDGGKAICYDCMAARPRPAYRGCKTINVTEKDGNYHCVECDKIIIAGPNA